MINNKVFKPFTEIPEYDKPILVVSTEQGTMPFVAYADDHEEEVEYLDGFIEYVDTPGLHVNAGTNMFVGYLHDYGEEFGWIYLSDAIFTELYAEMLFNGIRGI